MFASTMISKDIVLEYISRGGSTDGDHFCFDISDTEKIAVRKEAIEAHPYCKEYRSLLRCLSRVSLWHHTPYVGKTWMFFDGVLTPQDDRRYAISITNTSEYAVHVYKKSTNLHMFCAVVPLGASCV